MENVLIFKTGTDLPILESKKYELKSIKCLTGIIDDFRINVDFINGKGITSLPISFPFVPNFSLHNIHSRSSAILNFPLDLTNKKGIELSVTPLKKEIEYNFVINYTSE